MRLRIYDNNVISMQTQMIVFSNSSGVVWTEPKARIFGRVHCHGKFSYLLNYFGAYHISQIKSIFYLH